MKKYVVEFIGTFLFVLAICMIVIGGGAGNAAPIGIGSTLMVMIFAGGHISGGHFNPAVTLGVMLRGSISMSDSIGYWVSQIVAGVLAPIVAALMLPDAADPVAMTHDVVPSLMAEFFGTFALVYVVLQVATAKGTEGNSFYGLAIGFTVTAMAYAFGGVSGGAFNPAVAVGITTAGLSGMGDIWIYLVANLGAGAVAAYTFLFVNGKE